NPISEASSIILLLSPSCTTTSVTPRPKMLHTSKASEELNLGDLDYELPEGMIASFPLPKRTESRLFYIDKSSGNFSHHIFADLPTLLQSGDVLVINDTKVIPARLNARRGSGGSVEFLLLNPVSPACWEAMANPLGKLVVGEELKIDGSEMTVRV